jgi:hypothetical protein
MASRLLQAVRPRWAGVAVGGALSILALALRASLLRAVPYGDEAAHFTEARSLGLFDLHVAWMGPDVPFGLLPLVAGRPMFALLHAPGALAGFTGFRALGILYAALLPAVLYGLLRSLGCRRALAGAAGAAVAVLPVFVVWGSRVFPDSLMALLFLAGLWALQAGRVPLAAACLVASAWTKETAVFPVAIVAAAAWASAALARRKAGEPWAKALRPRRAEGWLLGAAAAAPLALGMGLLLVPKLPGWVFGGTPWPVLERMPLSALLLVPLAGAAFVRRCRPVALPGLAVLGLYAAFVALRGGMVQAWYAILPASLALGATALLADTLLARGRAQRLAGAGCVALLAATGLLGVVGASGPALAALHPLHAEDEPGLAASLAFVRAESPEQRQAMAFHGRVRPASVFQVDPAWFFIDYPFGGARNTTFVYTVSMQEQDIPVARIAAAVESSDLTWLQDWNTTFQHALRDTYRDCLAFQAGMFMAFEGRGCAARSGQLADRFAAARGASAGHAA